MSVSSKDGLYLLLGTNLLQSEDDAQNSSEDPHPPQRRDDSPSGSATTSADQRLVKTKETESQSRRNDLSLS